MTMEKEEQIKKSWVVKSASDRLSHLDKHVTGSLLKCCEGKAC